MTNLLDIVKNVQFIVVALPPVFNHLVHTIFLIKLKGKGANEILIKSFCVL